MYEFFAKIQGAEVISVKRGKDFGLDLDGITKILDDKTKMILSHLLTILLEIL